MYETLFRHGELKLHLMYFILNHCTRFVHFNDIQDQEGYFGDLRKVKVCWEKKFLIYDLPTVGNAILDIQ